MIPAFDRGEIPKRILQGLSQDGPSPLQKIYGFCGATHGGHQHFVRQELSRLTADCKVRRNAGDLYAVTQPLPAPPEGSPPIEPTAEVSEETPAPEQATVADMPSAPEASTNESESQPAIEETEPMQTQTQTKTATRKARNGHGTKPAPAAETVTKTGWIVAVVSETGTAKFSDLFKRAVKEGIFKEAKNLGAALCALTAKKKLKKVERGVYAMPGAQVVYDAEAKKAAASKKRTADDVKKVALGRKSTSIVEKKAAPVRSKPSKKSAKPGRKPSPLKSLYERVDAKIEENRAADDKACADIREIDEKIASLQKKRVEHVSTRDAARESVKKLREGRKRITELEAGVADVLKD